MSLHRILIVCEGKTERFYLEGLKRTLPRHIQRNIDIDILTAKEGEPAKAIAEVNLRVSTAKREKQPYKESWLVFDDDNRNLVQVFRLLEKHKICFAYSSIAIEFWFLLHFRNTARQFPDADTVIRELRHELGTYSKTDTQLWNKLAQNYGTAQRNALALRQQYTNDEIMLPDCRPYTNIDELVEKIKSLVG